MRHLTLLIFFAASLFAASPCDTKLFSFSVSNKESSAIRILDIIENLADECRFSVMTTDGEVRERLNTPLHLVNVHDYTLDDLFDYLFSQHNIFHAYDPVKKVLTLSYLGTESFNIDYVNLSEQKTESVKSISVGAASTVGSNSRMSSTSSNSASSAGSSTSVMANGMNGGGVNSDFTTIRSVSEFKFWDNLEHQINALLSRDEDRRPIASKALINREAGIITVTGTKKQLSRIEDYIAHLTERLHKQILLETRIFELRFSDDNTSGVDWSQFDLMLRGDVSNTYTGASGVDTVTPTYSFSYNFGLDGLMDFLDRYGEIEVLSDPKILTLNNQPAVINVGNQLNYRYTSGDIYTTTTGSPVGTSTYELGSVFIGLTLNIVPEISEDDNVILRINPVVSEELDATEGIATTSSADSSDGIRSIPPDIKIKQLSSIVKVKSGHKVVIGGLISNRTSTINKGVPLLGDIPLLGRIFHHEQKISQKSELIFVITPRVVGKNEFPSIDAVEQRLERYDDEQL